jgi:hypothetical protein
MAIDIIEHQYIDPNLYSGSLDTMRTAMGEMFYDAVSGSTTGETIDYIGFDDSDITLGSENDWFAWSSNMNLKMDPAVSGTFLPNYRFPVRLYGKEDMFANDVEWLLYLIGGQGEENNYGGIYSQASFDDFMFEYKTQYSTGQSKRITDVTEDAGGRNPYKIQYGYNYYLKEYQNKLKPLTSVTTIPNLYLLDLFNNAVVNGEGIDFHDLEFTKEYVTLMDEVDTTTIETLWDPMNTAYMPPHEDTDASTTPGEFVDRTKNIRTYLDTTYPQSFLSQSLLDSMSTAFQNIIFDYSASFANTLMYDFDVYTTSDDVLSQWPYYVDIEYPKFEYYDGDEGKEVRTSLIANEYTARFTKLLKEVFMGDTRLIPVSTMTYSSLRSEYSATRTLDGAINTSEITTAEDTKFKYVDFMQFMQLAYNGFNSFSSNCFIMRPPNIESVAAYDSSGIYRFYNSIAASNVINDVYFYYWRL